MSGSAENNSEINFGALEDMHFEKKLQPFLKDDTIIVIQKAKILYQDLRQVIKLPRVAELMAAIKQFADATIVKEYDPEIKEQLLEYNDFWFGISVNPTLIAFNSLPALNKEQQKRIITFAVTQYKAMSGKADFDGMKNMAGGSCKRKGYPWNSRKVSRSPFRKLKTAKRAYSRWSKKQPIGFTATSSLKSMGKIPRASGCYELGSKYN